MAGSSEEDGARHHLVQFVARPVFYLATREAVGDDASLEAALRKACGSAADALSNGKFTALEVLRSGSNVDELPEELRHVVAAARPLLLRRVGRTLTPRTDALRNSQKAYDAVPRHTLATALRAGVVPSSSSFVGGLAELMARRKLTRGGSETVAQALARARLGLDSLPDDLKDTPENELGEDHAAQVELYRRRAEALVEAYGDDAYADFVCNTYRRSSSRSRPSSRRQKWAADALDELSARGRALAAAEDPMVTDSDRAFVWDDSVGRILDALVAVAHRAAEADVDTWRALGPGSSGSWTGSGWTWPWTSRTWPRTRPSSPPRATRRRGTSPRWRRATVPRSRPRCRASSRRCGGVGGAGAVGGAARRGGAGRGARQASEFLFGGLFSRGRLSYFACYVLMNARCDGRIPNGGPVTATTTGQCVILVCVSIR